MEALAPPLRLLQTARYAMESGESLRQGLHDYLSQEPDEFTSQVRVWLQLLERGCDTHEVLQKTKSPARRHLLVLFERGLQGEPILASLASLDEELQDQALMEMEAFLGHLPFRMLLPLLFFLFPAFLLLLLGPLLMRIVVGVA